METYTLGIIGTGRSTLSVGWQVAEELCKTGSPVSKILLFNRTFSAAENLAVYLESAVLSHPLSAAVQRPCVQVCRYLDDIINQEPDVVFISFEAMPRQKIVDYEQRFGLEQTGNWKNLVEKKVIKRENFLDDNANAMAKMAGHFRNYTKRVIINTNPVDVMTYVFLAYSQMSPELVAGFNESCNDRFRRLLLDAVRKCNPLYEPGDISSFVVGPHNEYVVPVFSQAVIDRKGFYSVAEEFRLSAQEIKARLIAEAGRWFGILGSTSLELAIPYAKTIEAAGIGGSYSPVMSVYLPKFSVCIGLPVDLSQRTFRQKEVGMNPGEWVDLIVAIENTRQETDTALRIINNT